jgi:hypothetical protein
MQRGDVSMKRIQFLQAANRLFKTNSATTLTYNSGASHFGRIKSTGFCYEQIFEGQIKHLNPSERKELESQINRQLTQERRRCNAHAGNYDANRHIRLYMMEKALAQNDFL